MQGLLERIQDKLRAHMSADASADDEARIHINDERDIGKALPSRDEGEVGDPELVRPVGRELALDQVARPGRGQVRPGGAEVCLADHALQALGAHQALYGAACHGYFLTVHLAPDLVGAIDLAVGLPGAVDIPREGGVPLGTVRLHVGVAQAGGMATIGGRGDP
jgi:hypothetical protein